MEVLPKTSTREGSPESLGDCPPPSPRPARTTALALGGTISRPHQPTPSSLGEGGSESTGSFPSQLDPLLCFIFFSPEFFSASICFTSNYFRKNLPFVLALLPAPTLTHRSVNPGKGRRWPATLTPKPRRTRSRPTTQIELVRVRQHPWAAAGCHL